MFGRLLGPRSFDNPKGLLAHKQASFPITFGGIGHITTSTITPTTYLRSWVLVASIIIARFMVNRHPFLLETLMQVKNNTFLFQQHLQATCDLLSSSAWVCLPPFKPFIKQQMVHLQDSILECSHHDTFFNMFFDEILEAHCARILSCFGLGTGAWFIT
jgi:hypothetical protein